jgi:hypothetical protein
MPDCRKRCGGPCGRAAKKAIKRGTSLKKRCQEDILLVAFDEFDAKDQ